MKHFALLLALLLPLGAAPASTQSRAPDQPVHVLVGFLPGSPPDTFARMFGEALAAASGQPVVVENITGAAGSLAAERLARAPADGTTIAVLTEAQVVVNPHLRKLAYRPATDFAPVSQLFSNANLLVVGSGSPVKSVGELVALARQRPGALTFASGGNGSTAHLAGELFKSAAGVEIRHVPYRGILAAVPDLASGRVTMAFSPAALVLPLVREGRLRALAVTSHDRSPAAPEVPTLAEAGYPGLEIAGWNGLFAPAHTPSAVIEALHAQALRTLALPEVRAKLAQLALEPIGSTPAQLQAVIASESQRWAAVIKAAGITAD